MDILIGITNQVLQGHFWFTSSFVINCLLYIEVWIHTVVKSNQSTNSGLRNDHPKAYTNEGKSTIRNTQRTP